jgi:hypothetical protein
LEEIRAQGKGKPTIMTNVNQFTIKDDDDRDNTSFQLTMSGITTNPSETDNDDYEVEVEEGPPPLVSDADSDSEDEEYHPTLFSKLSFATPNLRVYDPYFLF